MLRGPPVDDEPAGGFLKHNHDDKGKPIMEANDLPWIATFVMLVLGWLSREGIGAYLKFRAARIAEAQVNQKIDDERAMAGYRELNVEMKARVSHLEGVIDAMEKKHDLVVRQLRDEHIACLKAQAEQSAKTAVLEDEVRSLREWRHDLANKAHTAVLSKELERVQGEAIT